MGDTQQGQNSGLLWVNSKIKNPDEFAPQDFSKWYEDVHIPDVLSTSGVKEAYRYETIDSTSERPYLAVYPLDDLRFVQSTEFTTIPLQHDSLPGSHAIFDLVDFDTRGYKVLQRFDREHPKTGPSNWMISEMCSPSSDEEYENWCKEHRVPGLAKVPEWDRTERYQFAFAWQGSPPKFLTLHYFGGELPPNNEQLKGRSDVPLNQTAVWKKVSYRSS